jgi:hypothetical protein
MTTQLVGRNLEAHYTRCKYAKGRERAAGPSWRIRSRFNEVAFNARRCAPSIRENPERPTNPALARVGSGLAFPLRPSKYQVYLANLRIGAVAKKEVDARFHLGS